MAKRVYENGELKVYWNSDLCIHCENCKNGLPQVFDPERRPWVDLSQAQPDEIRDQVRQCPTNALSLEPN